MGLAWEISDGEILAIVGPSGAGKTTLLQIAGTLDSPDSGRVCYDGTDVTGLKDRKLSAFRNANIGFVFQFHQLLPGVHGLENVAMPAAIGGKSRSKAEARAKRASLSSRFGRPSGAYKPWLSFQAERSSVWP